VNVEVFVLCDAATDSQGKLNILGAFDTLYAGQAPAIHPQCAIALRVRLSRIEQGKHTLAIQIVDDDGKTIIPPLEGEIEALFRGPEDTTVINVILLVQHLKLERYGEYSVNLAIGGRQEGSLPLYVKPISQ
jgi:hypothetical protein